MLNHCAVFTWVISFNLYNNSIYVTVILILGRRKLRLRELKEVAQVTEQQSWNGHGRQGDSRAKCMA